jgi:hypothetical protein
VHLAVREELIIAYYSEKSIRFLKFRVGAEMEVMRQKVTYVRHKVEIVYSLTPIFLFIKSVTKEVGVVRYPTRLRSLLVFVPRTCQMGASIRPRPLPDHIPVTTHPTIDVIVSEVLERRKIKE